MRHSVHASVDDLSCSASIIVEPQTWEDPGGVWIEDVVVVDDDAGGAEIDFESLAAELRERIEDALAEATDD